MRSLKIAGLYAFLGGNVLFAAWLWFNGSAVLFPFLGGPLIAIGRLLGILGQIALVFQIILMSRIRFIEREFGHDKMNRLHRIIGYSLIVFLLGHPLLLSLGYAQSNEVAWWPQVLDFIYNWPDVWKAAIGVGIFFLVIFLSLPAMRRKLKYEHWHLAHFLVYLAFLLVIAHQVNFADLTEPRAKAYWYALNFGIAGLAAANRFLYQFWLFYKHGFRVEKIVKETSDAYSIYLTGQKIEEFRFKAGQFANLMFLHGFSWPHPFSFSAPYDGKSIRFTVKESGDYTDHIKDIPPGTRVILDGPFGRFTEAAAKTSKFLLIAGGVGITPLRGLAEELIKTNKDVILLYGSQDPNDVIFKQELETIGVPVRYAYSRAAELPPGAERGIIDEEKIVRLVPDFRDRDAYICGPTGMLDAVSNTLKRLDVPRRQIHFEKFSY